MTQRFDTDMDETCVLIETVWKASTERDGQERRVGVLLSDEGRLSVGYARDGVYVVVANGIGQGGQGRKLRFDDMARYAFARAKLDPQYPEAT